MLWAFGTGHVGQSYLFKKQDQKFYEARVTYFSSLHNLHFTPARELTSAKNMDEAMYREVSDRRSGTMLCVPYHRAKYRRQIRRSQSDSGDQLRGVSRSGCRARGRDASVSVRGRKRERHGDFQSGTLRPPDSVDFCGACHATTWDVKLAGNQGRATRVRNRTGWRKANAGEPEMPG